MPKQCKCSFNSLIFQVFPPFFCVIVKNLTKYKDIYICRLVRGISVEDLSMFKLEKDRDTLIVYLPVRTRMTKYTDDRWLYSCCRINMHKMQSCSGKIIRTISIHLWKYKIPHAQTSEYDCNSVSFVRIDGCTCMLMSVWVCSTGVLLRRKKQMVQSSEKRPVRNLHFGYCWDIRSSVFMWWRALRYYYAYILCNS